jgi:hypothetical protein
MSPQELDSSQTVCQQKPQTFQSPELGLSSPPIYVGPASIPPSQPGNQLSFPQHVPLQSFPQDVCQNETQYPQQQDQSLFQGQQLQLDVTHMTASEGQWRNHSSFPRAQPLEDISIGWQDRRLRMDQGNCNRIIHTKNHPIGIKSQTIRPQHPQRDWSPSIATRIAGE